MSAASVWIELHCHSTCSDGSEPPAAVARRAAARGVELFCLTDHDTSAGYRDTLGSCSRVLRGVELSCQDRGRTVHILLYETTGAQARWAELDVQLAAMRAARIDRLRAIRDRLAGLGVTLDVEGVIASAGGRTVGRPDIARLLVEQGQVSSLDEAYRRYLGDGGVADVPLTRTSVADGLALGRAAGARMALAHPHTLGDHAVELVREHRDSGLEGLECYYGAYSDRQRKRWLQVARKMDLVITAGSDFHGLPTPLIAEPGMALPAPDYERLQRWLDG